MKDDSRLNLDEGKSWRACNRLRGKPQMVSTQVGSLAGKQTKEHGSNKADTKAAIRRQADEHREASRQVGK
jgi:hypothetical protein